MKKPLPIKCVWNGSKYTTTLTDSNNVLSKYNFKASISGVSFSVNGNKLTVSMDTAPSKEFTITATKKNAVRRGVVVWSEGKHGQNSSVQDVVSYAQEVSDSINGYVKMKVSYGSCQIVKTSEDGKVDGINFTITGNGINQTVTTANGGKFQMDNLMPGIYTVTEQAYDKEYVCDTDWTIREITPSEGYLLDKTIHEVGADPKLYEVEHNLTSNDVTEQVIKGNVAIIKHTDDGETKIETPEKGASFEIYLKSAGSYDAANKDERDTIVCDENGFGQTKDMPYGIYTVHQTSGSLTILIKWINYSIFFFVFPRFSLNK